MESALHTHTHSHSHNRGVVHVDNVQIGRKCSNHHRARIVSGFFFSLSFRIYACCCRTTAIDTNTIIRLCRCFVAHRMCIRLRWQKYEVTTRIAVLSQTCQYLLTRELWNGSLSTEHSSFSPTHCVSFDSDLVVVATGEILTLSPSPIIYRCIGWEREGRGGEMEVYRMSS